MVDALARSGAEALGPLTAVAADLPGFPGPDPEPRRGPGLRLVAAPDPLPPPAGGSVLSLVLGRVTPDYDIGPPLGPPPMTCLRLRPSRSRPNLPGAGGGREGSGSEDPRRGIEARCER